MNKIISELDEMRDYLEITTSSDPEEVKERIATLLVYSSRTGEMLADAKVALRMRTADEIQNIIMKIASEHCLSAKVQNALLDSIANEENYIVDRLERMNATIHHQIGALKSILSYEKEQAYLNKTGY